MTRLPAALALLAALPLAGCGHHDAKAPDMNVAEQTRINLDTASKPFSIGNSTADEMGYGPATRADADVAPNASAEDAFDNDQDAGNAASDSGTTRP